MCQYCPKRLVGVSFVPSGQPLCRYCPKRLAGVCHWYQVASRCVDNVRIDLPVCVYGTPVASRCVDIVQRDLSVCVIGTKWPAGVSILSEKTCRCVYGTKSPCITTHVGCLLCAARGVCKSSKKKAKLWVNIRFLF